MAPKKVTKKAVEKVAEVVADSVVEDVEVTPIEAPKVAKPKTKRVASTKLKAGTKRVAKKAVAETEEGDGEKSTRKRSFRLVVDSIKPALDLETLPKNGGRYNGDSPQAASRKAYSRLRNCCKKVGMSEDTEFEFSIEETSRGSAKGRFTYVGTATKLETPKEVTRDGHTWMVEYNFNVHVLKESKASPVVAPTPVPEVAPVVAPVAEVKVKKVAKGKRAE